MTSKLKILFVSFKLKRIHEKNFIYTISFNGQKKNEYQF